MTNRTAPPPDDRLAPRPYAKGLLKPFKGKGGILRLRDELMIECGRLTQMGIEISNRHNRWLAALDLSLRNHGDSSREGLALSLRWRDRMGKKMGQHLWDAAMSRDDVSLPLKQDLYDLEMERLCHNAQVSVVNMTLKRIRQHWLPDMEHLTSVFQTECNRHYQLGNAVLRNATAQLHMKEDRDG
ncbi:DUF3158 family protein [Halomonas elongata]|uniref:DUF3158 family protein n=1 Tax=Halomonas elongata (strain ATCC 33173 / DSM 2581 / NBRC 15536 / NCIMB 2198 / 1H9) TaxID=768066 RepID=E1VA31_HALED|nr:DUF3158 family protein [Halomonas elongata]WBF17658.1 DUF3158 family protein [Halomonas elongata]WPU46497.1 DUF3158 family protein [Halomonas elongata DSM 2581]CBV43919.1 DUF3158 family protein [Halomonas elongata DSM 2581]